MPRRSHRAHRPALMTVLVLSRAVPGLALGASSKPTVSTGAVANVTPQSVTLLGKIRPNAAATTYLFQYGPTTLYGSATPIAAAGNGTSAVNITADVSGLAPSTTYHYRLIA